MIIRVGRSISFNNPVRAPTLAITAESGRKMAIGLVRQFRVKNEGRALTLADTSNMREGTSDVNEGTSRREFMSTSDT